MRDGSDEADDILIRTITRNLLESQLRGERVWKRTLQGPIRRELAERISAEVSCGMTDPAGERVNLSFVTTPEVQAVVDSGFAKHLAAGNELACEMCMQNALKRAYREVTRGGDVSAIPAWAYATLMGTGLRGFLSDPEFYAPSDLERDMAEVVARALGLRG